jgi:tRNA(Ile)-lysidine synthase
MTHHFPSPDPPSDLVRRVATTIDRHGMFSSGERVLVGVSGGPDSTALLHILLALAPRYHLELAVAHFHHGLRAQAADHDALFVRQMALGLDLPWYEEKGVVQKEYGSIEESAREARYGFFRRLMAAHGYAKIALGHQKNDNAEAVLMHLMRGSGIRGLGGIPPVRDRWVVRPLIDLDRFEILAWLQQAGIAWVVDATNTDLTYERNRIRHHLIPLLAREYNPNIVEILHRTADLCREEDAWLTRHLRPLLEEAVTLCDDLRMELDLSVIASAPLAARRRLIREALARWHGHLRRMTAHHIDTLIGLMPDSQQGKRISLPFGIAAERLAGHLRFFHAARRSDLLKAAPSAFLYKVGDDALFPLTIDLPEAGCRLVFRAFAAGETFPFESRETLPLPDADRVVFDMDNLSYPLVIRNFQPGDRMTPFGLQGSQKIKKIFIDRKIPANRRMKIPLLACGGDIIWVAGVRRGDAAVLTPDTRQILEVTLETLAEPGIGRQSSTEGGPSGNPA